MKKIALLLTVALALPAFGNTHRIATITGNVVTATAGVRIGPYRVVIQCDNAVHIAFGDVNVAATATDLHLLTDQIWEDKLRANEDYISIYADSATTHCYVYAVSF